MKSSGAAISGDSSREVRPVGRSLSLSHPVLRVGNTSLTDLLESHLGTDRQDHVVALVVAVLVVDNLILNLVAPRWSDAVLNVVVMVVLIVLGRRSGRSWSALGLSPRDNRVGVRAAATVGLVVTAVLAIAAMVPPLRDVFDDGRFNGVSPSAAVMALATIPLTVAFEEVAFRGVLLGAVLRRTTTLRAVVVTSLLFGLWHIPASVDMFGTGRSSVWLGLGVLGVVAVTAVAGGIFCWLRLRHGGVAASWIVHTAFNATAYTLWVGALSDLTHGLGLVRR